MTDSPSDTQMEEAIINIEDLDIPIMPPKEIIEGIWMRKEKYEELIKKIKDLESDKHFIWEENDELVGDNRILTEALKKYCKCHKSYSEIASDREFQSCIACETLREQGA